MAAIRSTGELRICVAGSSAAFYQTNAQAFADFLGVTPKVTQLAAWDQQFQNEAGVTVKEATYEAHLLANGSCDLFPNDLHMTDWRRSKMLLVPLYTTRKMVVANHKMRAALKEPADLGGHSAAVQQGTAYESWLLAQNQTTFASKPVILHLAPTAESLERVATGASDFTVVAAETAFKAVRGDLHGLDLLFPVDDPVEVGWGLSPSASDLRQPLEKFFADSYRVDSELDRSWQRKYDISLMGYRLFSASFSDAGVDLNAILAWAVPFGAGMVCVLGAMLHWNRRLNREIAHRKKSEELLCATVEFNKTILLNSPFPMEVYTADGQCIEINDALVELVGGSREALLAQNIHSVKASVDAGLSGLAKTVVSSNLPQSHKATVNTSFGKSIYGEFRMLPVTLHGKLHLLMQVIDQTETKRIEEELRHLAFHDALTLLPNRRLLIEFLKRALLASKRTGNRMAVLFLDLNKFKALNDTYGHDTGDLLLVEVARRLKHLVRETDMVARLGGDEFVILLEGLGTTEADAVMYAASVKQKVSEALAEDYFFGSIRHSGSASVGVKLVELDDSDPDQILKDADTAMYLAALKPNLSFRDRQASSNPPSPLQHRMQQHIAPRRNVLRLRVLNLVMTDAIEAGNKDHPRRCQPSHIHSVVPCA